MTKQAFDLIQSPLDGLNLIEAGAGTGKTYTLAGLYLRLVIEKRIPVENILVVTFTEAATQELKERIRNRLKEALSAYDRGVSPDPLTAHFLDTSSQPKEDRDLLDMAIRSFDQAAVFTIHGFCQRMLVENAFESGALFDTELVTDTETLFRTVSADFFRLHVYDQSPLFLDYLYKLKITPDTFSGFVKKVLKPGIQIIPDVAWIDPSPLESHMESAFDTLSRGWPLGREHLWETITHSTSLNKNKYRTNLIPHWFRLMDRYLSAGADPLNLPGCLVKFTRPYVVGATKKNHDAPDHDIFDTAENLRAAFEDLDAVYQNNLRYLKLKAVGYIKEQLAERKQEQGLLSFDDLLIRLHQGLSGSLGKRLEDHVRDKFSVALIDEFQDTDPIQYDIFSRIFARQDNVLFMIGDPKQAIYSFRGADIFAYMHAASRARSGYELGKNYRSDSRLVTAVNTMFGGVETPFVFEGIGFTEAESALGKDFPVFSINGNVDAPFRVWLFDSAMDQKPLSKDDAGNQVVRMVAREIRHLINLGREGTALIGDKPVREGDMAILVRTNYQAKEMKQALTSLGIPAVIYDTGHVFHSKEALELQRILTAMARPGREGFIKTALSTTMMGFSSADLEGFEKDPQTLEPWLDRFKEYHDQWHRYGFIEAYNTFIKDRDVLARMMAYDQGERRNTNLSHMAQLLHQASLTGRDTPESLLSWLMDQIQSTTVPEEHQLRLERDDEAVKIVTVHKSKGLEYPIVFCPYLWSVTQNDKAECVFFHDPETRILVCDMGSADFDSNKRLADTEALAEDVRLLYVALTRAKNRCYMAWGRVNSAEKGAVGHLLTDKTMPEDDEALNDCFHRLEQQSDGTIRVEDIRPETGKAPQPDLPETSPLQVRAFGGTIEQHFKITSFSSLTARKAQAVEGADRDAATEKKQEPVLDDASQQKTIFTFPKGAAAGTFLHDIFEHVDFGAGDDDLLHLIEQKLAAYTYDPEWKDCILTMVRHVLHTQLDHHDPVFTLSGVPMDRRLNELEFYFPLNRIDPQSLGAVFARHHVRGFSTGHHGAGQERHLTFSPVEGYLKGFIDLVFSRKVKGVERFYIVDWKSNYLGCSSDDYRTEVLGNVMAEEHYILQYHLYVLALHRYLAVKLGPSYRYGTHFGGVYYLFLRGMNPMEKEGHGIFFDLPDQALIADLADLLWGPL